jgi:hypothetical protein
MEIEISRKTIFEKEKVVLIKFVELRKYRGNAMIEMKLMYRI